MSRQSRSTSTAARDADTQPVDLVSQPSAAPAAAAPPAEGEAPQPVGCHPA